VNLRRRLDFFAWRDRVALRLPDNAIRKSLITEGMRRKLRRFGDRSAEV
jgi:hypothetical protein